MESRLVGLVRIVSDTIRFWLVKLRGSCGWMLTAWVRMDSRTLPIIVSLYGLADVGIWILYIDLQTASLWKPVFLHSFWMVPCIYLSRQSLILLSILMGWSFLSILHLGWFWVKLLRPCLGLKILLCRFTSSMVTFDHSLWRIGQIISSVHAIYQMDSIFLFIH